MATRQGTSPFLLPAPLFKSTPGQQKQPDCGARFSKLLPQAASYPPPPSPLPKREQHPRGKEKESFQRTLFPPPPHSYSTLCTCENAAALAAHVKPPVKAASHSCCSPFLHLPFYPPSPTYATYLPPLTPRKKRAQKHRHHAENGRKGGRWDTGENVRGQSDADGGKKSTC